MNASEDYIKRHHERLKVTDYILCELNARIQASRDLLDEETEITLMSFRDWLHREYY